MRIFMLDEIKNRLKDSSLPTMSDDQLAVFSEIVTKKSVSLEALEKDLAKILHSEIRRERVKASIKNLVDAELVKEMPSLVEDFNQYYSTAKGLGISRKMGI
jgi:hypothetical protein